MSTVAAPPASPFKGLSAFEDSELDASLFFGRDRERDVIVANMLAARLTVLYGASGVGKSSILRAGVVRALREVAPAALVEVHDAWSTEDAGLLLTRARAAPEAYLVLDQFEEFFLYRRAANGSASFVRALGDLLRDTTRVNVLVSLREDALAQLDGFRQEIPGILANRLQLRPLDREAARAAIVGPVERWAAFGGQEVEVEPALVEAVLDEVSCPIIPGGAADGGIEAPYLQLVLQRVWDEERARASPTLRLETLRRLGGAQAIVRDHLERALGSLDPEERRVAGDVFGRLVTPSGTKIAHRLGDLAQYASVSEEQLGRTLGTLARERIVRPVDGGEGAARRYEIFHDVLVESVRAWQARRELESERAAAARRQRRLLYVAAASLAALAIVAAVAIFALAQRSSARSQARHAHARELEATALQQLAVDPEQSLMLALDAARLEAGARAEDVLRQALVAARLRLVLSSLGPVRAVAYSPGGSLITTASSDGRVRIFDAATGRRVRVLREWGKLGSVAFSPDGTRVLAAADDGFATVWDARSGRRLRHLRHRGAVTSAVFSRDGGVILTASRDRTIRVFSAATGRTLRVLREPGPVSLARLSPDATVVASVATDAAGQATARLEPWRKGTAVRLDGRGIDDAAFSPDGRVLATASRDGTTRLFDGRNGRFLRALDDRAGGIVSVAFSPDGELLAAASSDGGLRVWSVADGVRVFYFGGHTNGLTTVAWSPDGRLVAAASADRTASLWAVRGLIEAGTLVARLAGHGEAVSALAFAPDGRRLVTGGGDWSARVWDARPEQVLRVLGRTHGGAAHARYGAGGRLVVAAGVDGFATVWDARTRRLVRRFGGGGAALEDAQLSPDARTLATAGDDGRVRVWDVASGALLRTLRQGGRVRVAAFGSDGRLLVSAGTRGARLWEARTGRLLATLGASAPVADVAWSPDSSRVATATARGFDEWNAPAGRLLLHVRPGAVTRVVFAPGGDLLAVGMRTGDVRLYGARGRLEHLLRGHRLAVTALAFGADGRTLVSASVDHDARSWDTRTGRLIHVFRGHFGPVRDVALSRDGRWVATAGPTSAGVWPSSSGRLLFYLRGDTGLLRSIAFSPDGRQILTASMDGTVRTYSCDACGTLDELVAIAGRRLGRVAAVLTPGQRARYLSR